MSGNYQYAYQVTRADFDHLLLKNAAAKGTKVFEGTEIELITFDKGRPVAAQWRSVQKRELTGTITFDYVVDASGRAGVLGSKCFRNRRYHQAFENIALWGYWRGVRAHPKAVPGMINVGSLPDGWIWGIPLHDGTMSVGLVLHKDAFNKFKDLSRESLYTTQLATCPLFQEILKEATLTTPVKTETDYSYTSDHFAGPGYFLVGDSACFIDPLLSSGVHLATYSGLLAAASLSSLLRNEADALDATNFYETSYRQAYLRFLVFVATFYDQARGQKGYFQEAQKLTHVECDASSLKSAFLNLVTGLEDLANAEQGIPNLVMAEMSKRLKENLTLRKDKSTLQEVRCRKDTADNVKFFDAVEGMGALSSQSKVNGWYVATHPKLGLVRQVETIHQEESPNV
jgi:flavin-dependent dehydrogenase